MADGDILDYISNNWSQLLGMGGPTAPPAPPPSPASGPQFSPSGVMDTQALTGSPTGAPSSGGFQPPPASPNPYTQAMIESQSGMPGMPAAAAPGAPSAPVPGVPGPGPSQGLPLIPGPTGPTTAPPAIPGGGGANLIEGRQIQTIPGGGGMQPPNFSGVPIGSPMGGSPLSGAPITGASPPTATTGSLAGALGLPPRFEGGTASPANPFSNGQFGSPPPQPGQNPNTGRANLISNFLAGLGKGLTAVGNVKPGTPAAGAFSAGAGGGLTGGLAQENAQQMAMRQARNDYFTQLSTAWRDKLAAQASDNSTALTEANIKLANARSGAIALTGSAGGHAAYQTTPLGQAKMINDIIQSDIGPKRKSIDASVRSGQLLPEEAKAQYAALDKREQDLHAKYEKQYPNAAKQGAGESEANPIQAKGMSEDQFHAQVPLLAYFDSGNKYGADGRYTVRNKDGSQGQTLTGTPGAPVIVQRLTPPPGWTPPSAQPAQPASPPPPGPQASYEENLEQQRLQQELDAQQAQ